MDWYIGNYVIYFFLNFLNCDYVVLDKSYESGDKSYMDEREE